MALRTVIGTVLRSDGSPWANAKVLFKLNKLSVDLTSDEVFPPKQVSVVTDEDGLFSIDLWVNQGGAISCRYDVTIGGGSASPIVLPAGGSSADLSDLIAAGDTSLATTDNIQTAIDLVARPYEVYTALLTQTGTNAPVATVLENTLGGTVVWTRSLAGTYVGTLAGAFTANKTALLPMQLDLVGTETGAIVSWLDENSVNIVSVTLGDLPTVTPADSVLINALIEIRVYP